MDDAGAAPGLMAPAGGALAAMRTAAVYHHERAPVPRDRDLVTDGDGRASTRAAGASEGALPGGDVTVDEMSDASFPASDPPATWTWEVRTTAAYADDPDSSKLRSR
jgi:hypothetical protein